MALCLHDGPVCAEILAAAFDAACAAPYGIELFAERLDNGSFIRKDAVLEIPLIVVFRAKPRACQIGAAKIGCFAIGDDAFEMHTRAEDAFHLVPQTRKTVEIATEIRARFFGMNQADRDAFFQQRVQYFQKRHHVLSSRHFDIHVLQIGRGDPQAVMHGWNDRLGQAVVYLSV